MAIALFLIGYSICFLGILFYRDMYVIPREYKKWCEEFDADAKNIWGPM